MCVQCPHCTQCPQCVQCLHDMFNIWYSNDVLEHNFWLLLGLYDINMVENRLVCVKSRDFNFHEPVILSKELTLTFGNIKLKVRTK